MSHQDAVDGTANAEQLKAALQWLVPEDRLEDLAFRQPGVWSPLTLVFAAIMWSFSGKPTLTKRFAEARKTLAFGAAEDQQPGTSYSGFIKRLGHWSSTLQQRVVAEFRHAMRQMLSEWFLVGGWLVFAGDGSRTATPRTRSNEQNFAAKKKKRKRRRGKARSARREKQLAPVRRRRRRKQQSQADREKKATTPQIWLTMLYHVGLGLPWDWRSGPSDSSEREHLLEMAEDLRHLPEQALITLDAGFVGYEFWHRLDQVGVSFVARVGANVRLLKNLGHVRRRQDIVSVWPDQVRRRGQPPLVLRLHRFCGGQEDVYLVTNVLDGSRLSSSQMQEIYAARWGVEVYYRDLKQTFGKGKLLSKASRNAQLELDWSIIGLWATCLYATAQHAAAGIPPGRRSLAGVLHAFRLPLEQPKSLPDEQEDLASLIADALKDEYERHRPKASRNQPRKKKKHAIGKPQIASATKEQQTAARNLKTAA